MAHRVHVTALARALALGCALACVHPARAYETDTHAEVLSRQAVSRSVLLHDPLLLRNLGIDDPVQKFPDSKGAQRTIAELVEFGAVSEDNVFLDLAFPVLRMTRHFYNPLTGKGMDEGPFRNQKTSPDWALAPRGSDPDQKFSYWDARRYFLEALTGLLPSDRNRGFGETFQTLGHVIHHLQDMAQPQHVRNDVHCTLPLFLLCKTLQVRYSPSFYEHWTNLPAMRSFLAANHTALPGGYDITSAAFTSTFNTPRSFWHTVEPRRESPAEGRGIAEFTNRNFVSAGTNFDRPGQPSPPFFALPAFDPGFRSQPKVKEICANPQPAPPCPPPIASRPEAVLTFYGTRGRDNFLGAPLDVPRASSESIFDQELRVHGARPVFALNRFNFAEAHQHLLPRAIAFSAGMINYFFRGRIDLAFVPAQEGQAGGFFVRNLGSEPMKGEFSLYYDDAQSMRKRVKDRAGADVAWRTTDLLPEAQGLLAAGGSMPVTVDFDTPPDARTPGEYMMVFVGEMGEEKTGTGMLGAVAGKLIRAAPYRGELYVAGFDAQQRIVTFKVDTAGLRVLNGPDANGVIRSTPTSFLFPNQRDMDPLLPFIQNFQTEFRSGFTVPLERVKQVEFERGTFGDMSHRTVGLSLRRKFDVTRYTLHAEASRLAFSSGDSIRWLAGNPDVLPGQFEFTPEIQNNSINGNLFYVRRWRAAPGAPLQVTTGRVTLPTFPSPAFSEGYRRLNNASVVVSPDGLTVSFRTIPLALRVTLAEQPSAALVQTEGAPPRTTTSDPPVNQSTVTDTSEPPDEHVEFHTHTASRSTEETGTGPMLVDYIKDQLVTWRQQTRFVSQTEFTQDSTRIDDFEPNEGCPQTRTTSDEGTARHTSSQVTTTTAVLEQPVVSVIVNRSHGSSLFPENYTRNFSIRDVEIRFCSGGLQVIPRQVVDNLVHDPLVPGSVFTGLAVERTLNGTRKGSIMRNFFGSPEQPGAAYFIGDTALGDGQLGGRVIFDASPLGEIFVARTDTSVVVYDPLPGTGMPRTIQIPSNIVRLLAVLWY